MASRKAVEAILDQALAYCRRYSESERAGALETWCNVFALTDSKPLADAVLAWIQNLDDTQIRAQILPTPKTLNRIMTRGDALAAPPDRTPPKVAWPSRAYVDAHVRAARRISGLAPTVANLDDALSADPPPPHAHKPPTIDTDSGDVALFGNEDCARCAWDLENDEAASQRRRQIEEVLSSLPSPTEEAADCRCGDTGMIETIDSAASLRSLDPLHREVYPCPSCRPDAFHTWREGGYSLSRS